MELTDRVALVTGAARGLGAVIAARLADAGARVVIADVLDDAGTAVAGTIGSAASYSHLDVTEESDWTSVVERIVGAHGRLDVLVNNAAILHMGSIENTPAETYRRVVEVNTVGPFLGTRAVMAQMKAQQRGSIVNIASIDGLIGTNGITAYSASKFGLRGMAKSAALELGRDDIRVNCVCASGGNAEMFGPWMEQIMPFLDDTMAFQNDRAIPGSVSLDEIAAAVLYLASDASSGLTGIDLPVDNGATAGHHIPGFSTL